MLTTNKFKEAICRLYEPDGTVHKITNVLTFTDLRVQIKENQLKGCYVIWKDQRINIDHNGRSQDWVPGFYDEFDNLLDKLL